MKWLKKINFRTVLLHLLFWAAVWFFFYYFFSYNSDDKAYVTWFSSFLLPLTMIVTYIFVYRLIPRYLLTRHYWRFALYTFYTLVFSSYIIVLIIYGCLIFLLYFNISVMPPMSKNYFFILILVLLVVGIVSFISLLNFNFRTSSRNRELQNKILAAQLQMKEQELNYLKMQIHPHFLFNTLNTIYGFALKQSKQTPAIILKLSNLLDYILYQIEKPWVVLEEEVAHIKEYVDLEKIRFQDSLRVEFETKGIDSDIVIAPMLLIPFVENAFKHGNIISGVLDIHISIRVERESLYFGVDNSWLGKDTEGSKGGIGLENVKKRLDLHYKDSYRMEMKTEINKFTARLEIFNLKTKKEIDEN